MHLLAHTWAKDRQGSEQQGVAWIAAGCVLTLSRSNTYTWQRQERHLLLHVQPYLDIEISRMLSPRFQTIAVPILPLLKFGWALLDMRQDTRLGHLLKDIFIELRQNPEELSQESLPLYDLQAQSLLNLGKNKKAVVLLEQVVQIRGTTLRLDDSSRLASQHALAGAYKANGQVKEAVATLEQVVQIRGTTLMLDHPDRLTSQHALALAYKANGQVKEAVTILKQVVKIKQSKLRESHPSRVVSDTSLLLTR